MTNTDHPDVHERNDRGSTLERDVEELIDQKLEEALGDLRARIEEARVSDRATLVVFSGDMDKLMAAFIIATGAAAMGLEVSMYFTFWGLTAVKKTPIFKGKSIPERMMAAMLPSGPRHVGTSKMNMLGMGPLFFKMMMKKKNVETLPDLISLARELGVRMVACQMSMDVTGIQREELMDGLDYGGVATYLGDASDSKVTLFI